MVAEEKKWMTTDDDQFPVGVVLWFVALCLLCALFASFPFDSRDLNVTQKPSEKVPGEEVRSGSKFILIR